ARPKGFPDLKAPIQSLPTLMEVCDGKIEYLHYMLEGEMSAQKIDQV
ncbi:unnamed protein product, partial [Lymnaea stagnalis]